MPQPVHTFLTSASTGCVQSPRGVFAVHFTAGDPYIFEQTAEYPQSAGRGSRLRRDNTAVLAGVNASGQLVRASLDAAGPSPPDNAGPLE